MNNIVWSCPLDCSGYSQCGRDYVLCLHENKWNVKYETPIVSTLLDGRGIDAETHKRLKMLAANDVTTPYVRVSHSVPDRFIIDPEADVNIGYTVVETDAIPSHWPILCNKMDAIFTASSYCKDVLAQSGVTVPIFVIPHCHDAKQFNFAEKFNICNLKKYNFLFMADMTPRKGWQRLVEAYCREFAPEEDVSLTFKAYFGDFSTESQNRCKEKIRDYAASIGYSINVNTAPFYFYGHCLPNSVVPRFTNTFDCIVAPHSGEGWSLVCSQAMLLGKLTIATEYSGNLEFMNHNNSLLIPVGGWESVPAEMVEINHNYGGLDWPVADAAKLQELLRKATQNTTEITRLAEQGQTDILQKFSYKAVAGLIHEAIEQIYAYKKGILQQKAIM